MIKRIVFKKVSKESVMIEAKVYLIDFDPIFFYGMNNNELLLKIALHLERHSNETTTTNN